MKQIAWAKISVKELFSQLGTSPDGLPAAEAKQRAPHRPVEKVWPAKKVLNILARQVRSPLVLLLVFAAALSFALGEKIDALVIFIIVAVNTLISFIEEYHSARILENLEKYIPNLVTVRRGVVLARLKVEEIVDGDVVLIQAGDLVPADIRLIKSEGLMADESVLTGESFPVMKNATSTKGQDKGAALPANSLFAGTKLTAGQGEGVVVAAGKQTLLGQIGKKAQEIIHPSLFEKNIIAFSRLLLLIVLTAVGLIFVLSVIFKRDSLDLVTLLLFVLALAIGILPEALPAVTTITLAHGALRLAKKSVVLRRLSAVEDFGNIDVLCTDKTGTLTENAMAVKEVKSNLAREEILELTFLAREGETLTKEISNPFDSALYQALPKEASKRAKQTERLQNIPFDLLRRINSAVVKRKNELLLIARGAPEEVIKRSSLSQSAKQSALQDVKELGAKGLRTLAIGTKIVEKKSHYTVADETDLTLGGIIAFADPLRPSTAHALALAQKLGVEIKILTGDHPEVSKAIAEEAGLITHADRVLTKDNLDNLSDNELTRQLDTAKVFARVTPDDKLRLIQLLEKQGKKVAYMGDGVNDVPALAAAYVAIAAPAATGAAKEICDIVLLKKDLAVIVEGLVEGRKIFKNITKYLTYSLGGNLGNFLSLGIISLFSPLLPQLPTQILLGNFISDFPLLAIGWDTIDVTELRRPQNYNLSSIRNRAVRFAVLSSIFDFAFFGLFWHSPIDLLRTLWFIESMITEILLLFSVRSFKSIFSKPHPSAILMILSVGGIAISIILPYLPAGAIFHFVSPASGALTLVLVLSLGYLIANELMKKFFRHFYKNKIVKGVKT